MNQKFKIARVATVPFFLDHQLKHQFRDLIEDGFDVTTIGSNTGDWSGLENTNGLKCLKIDICRQPAPVRDLIALTKLYHCFKQNKFHVVHSTTPKAGLLCAIASFLAGVPVRLHTFTGQTWETKQGLSKLLLRFFDKIIVKLNTRCYADSESQRAYLNSNGVGDKKSIKVLASGSLAGVDLERFDIANYQADRQKLMTELKISSEDFVIIFIGRLSKEKGVYELLEVVESLAERHENIKLLLVGPCEESSLAQHIKSWINKPVIRYIGETNFPERYLAISNVLCLPSYREGFGTVVIEAAAMKIPTLGTNITGLVDAVENGVTGMLVKPANSEELMVGLEYFIENQEACNAMGKRAFTRCLRLYDSKKISRLIQEDYYDLIYGMDKNAKSAGHRS